MRQFLAGMSIALALGLYALALANTAWLCDDAYISFRSIDNLIHGYGLTWNIDERVQTFTDPLWVLLNVPPALFLKEPWHIYFSALLVCAVVSLSTVLLIAFGVARNRAAAVFALLALTFSRAYVDFSTSGLENPMTHLLLAVFCLLVLRTRWTPWVTFSMSLCAGLSMTNRMDAILLFAPVLAYAWLGERNLRTALVIAMGFLPFVAWEVFSIIYYGFPFPNTAYAKLGSAFGADILLPQGLSYVFWNPLTRDPATLFLLLAGLVAAPVVLREGRYRALALGGIAYLCYVVKFGGDFMEGRFLAAPMLVGVLLLSRLPWRSAGRWVGLATVTVAMGLTVPNAPLLCDDSYGGTGEGFLDARLVGDERRAYMFDAGLRFWDGASVRPTRGWAREGRKMGASNRYQIHEYGAVGFMGYFAGPKVHMVDPNALGDPLLARIPALYEPHWRIGHFKRYVPGWYSVMLTTMYLKLDQRNIEPPMTCDQIVSAGLGPQVPDAPASRPAVSRVDPAQDPNLMEYYRHLSLIIRGPIWDAERWRTILAMNLGRYNHLIEEDLYRFPELKFCTLDEVSASNTDGKIIAPKARFKVPSSGVDIDLGKVSHGSRIEFSASQRDRYLVLFCNGTEIAGKADVRLGDAEKGQLAVVQVDVPNSAIRAGYDHVRLVGFRGEKPRSFGHFRMP